MIACRTADGERDRPRPADASRERYAGILVKRTTVKLPDELDARLRHEAERRGRTVSDLTREAIGAYLGGTGGGGGRRLLAAGAGRSGHSDISELIEEIIAREGPPSPS